MLSRASVHCQGRSLFRPLGSPGDTGGPLSTSDDEDNFIKRPRVAVTLLLLTGQEAQLSGPLEQPGSAPLGDLGIFVADLPYWLRVFCPIVKAEMAIFHSNSGFSADYSITFRTSFTLRQLAICKIGTAVRANLERCRDLSVGDSPI